MKGTKSIILPESVLKYTSSDLIKERKILLRVGTLYVVIALKQGKAWNEKLTVLSSFLDLGIN